MNLQNTPKLETERLILRRFTEGDLADMFQLYSDPLTNQFLPWEPFASLQETREYLHTVIFEEYSKDLAYCYALEEKRSCQVIGYVVLHHIQPRPRKGELGYGLRSDYWNQGYMTEACLALIQRLKEDGFSSVVASHDVNNPASGSVLKKLGMTYQSTITQQDDRMAPTLLLYEIII